MSKDWGIVYWRETELTFELYTFKWGVPHLFEQEKASIEEAGFGDVEAFRDWLKTEAIEFEPVLELELFKKETIEEEDNGENI